MAGAEPAALTVEIAASSLGEGAGPGASTITVTRNQGLDTALEVDLACSDRAEVWLPTSRLTIPAGSGSASLTLDVVDDGELDGAQTATVTASAPDWVSGSDTVEVKDNDAAERRTIGGPLTGNLVAGEYEVTQDLVVPQSHSLTVAPGAMLRFHSETGVRVYGQLLADATPEARIVWTSATTVAAPGDWRGIHLENAGEPRTVLDEVEISYAVNGVSVIPDASNPLVTVSHSDVHHNSENGIEVRPDSGRGVGESDVQILGNSIHHNGGNGVYLSAYSIGSRRSANATFVGDNEISFNAGAGVFVKPDGVRIWPYHQWAIVSSTITRNLIHHNAEGIYGYSARWLVEDNSTDLSARIINNLIVENETYGVRLLVASRYADMKAKVVNNTIANNGSAGILHTADTDSGFLIRNNVLTGNASGIEATAAYTPAEGSVGFNNVYGNTGGDWILYPASFGDLTDANANGTPADAAMNISVDPQYVAVGNYHLSATSPVINAGTSSAAPADDYDQEPRSDAIDLGFDEVHVQALDWGDAPAPYPTTLARDGARHVANGPQLGAARDAEGDGQPTLDSDGDDAAGLPDDEDGITFGSVRSGQLEASVTIRVQNAPSGARLDAWIDFDGDGTWGGPFERIAPHVAVQEGDNTLRFDVPSGVRPGPTYARFRLSSTGGLAHTGQADDGEVEDLRLTIQPPAAASGEFGGQHVISAAADWANSAVAADLDGDGDMDVLRTSAADDTIAWHENDGQQNFTAHVISRAANGAIRAEAIDLDADGDLDVLAASTNDDTIAWYQNDGRQGFTFHPITTSADEAWSVFVADLDGDGDLDVLSASRNDDTIAWYENDGSQNFTPRVISTAADGARSVFAADLDGDGDLDVLSASQFDDTLAWYENDGSENFTPHAISTTAAGARSIYAADLDGDGDMDVLSASYDDGTIAWHENDGHENFNAHAITASAAGAQAAVAADVDGDGDLDVLSASANADMIAWHENGGRGNFALHAISTAVDGAVSVFAADLDGDGDLDVLSASVNDDRIAWYENGAGRQASLTLEPTTMAKREGDSGSTAFTFTVTRTGSTAGTTTVDWAVTGSGMHPTDAGDFAGGTLPGGTLTLTNGEANKTITVSVAGDVTREPDEGFTVTLANASNAQITTATATGTVQNDDPPGFKVDMEVVAVTKPSAAGSNVLPAAVSQIPLNGEYYVELWGQDLSADAMGVQGGSVDLHYSNTAMVDAAGIMHQDFAVLPTGQILDPQGIVDDVGGATFDPLRGVAPQWARLAYVHVTATAAGTVDYSLSPGQFQFALSGFGNVDWSQVDLSDTAQVEHGGGAQVDVRLVRTPTVTSANGEVSAIPASAAWLGEWEPYWAEVYLSTPHTDALDVTGADVALNYSTAIASATRVDFHPSFSPQGVPVIDDAAGRITGIHAATSVGDLGDDRPVLLARVLFEPTAVDQAAVDVVGRRIGPYGLNVSPLASQVSLGGNAESIAAQLGPAAAAEVWAVPYDVDDSDLIDFGDFSRFAPRFGESVTPADPYTWWADFDRSGAIDFGDFSYFAPNFAKAKPNAVLQYPGNFPEAWRRSTGGALAGDGGEGESPLLTAAGGTIIDAELAALLQPSGTDTLPRLPDSAARVTGGSEYYVEVWVQQARGGEGISGGSLDVRFSPSSAATFKGIAHGDVYTVLTGGRFLAPDLVDDLRGATFSGGLGVAPQWVRLGYVQLIAAGKGEVTHMLEPGSLQFSLFGTGNVPWTDVTLDAVTLDVTLTPWRNTPPCDVNNDGKMTALDVLVLINDINVRGARDLPVPTDASEAPPPYLDPTGDNRIEGLDVLFVINFLNANAGAAEGEAGLPGAGPPTADRWQGPITNALGSGFDPPPPATNRGGSGQARQGRTVRIDTGVNESGSLERRKAAQTAAVEPGERPKFATRGQVLDDLDPAVLDHLFNALGASATSDG